MYSFLRIMLLLLFGIIAQSSCVEAVEPIKIGVLAFRPKPQTLQQWQPLAIALQQALPGHDFQVDAYAFDELEQAVLDKQIDFVLTNPGHYVLLTKKVGLSAPLATLSVDQAGHPLSLFGGVIFARAELGDINTLADIKDKTVASVSTDSFGGYQMQAYELIDAGIRVPQGDKLLTIGMPQDKVVQAVLELRAEVGFVRTGVLESMAREGKLDLDRLKIINAKPFPGTSLRLSTRLYPEWAFAVMPHVDSKLARHVAAALYVLEDNAEAVKAMNIHGFVVSPDYTPVADLLKTLRLPPFHTMPSFTLHDVLARYFWQLLLACYALFLILLLGIRLWLTRRKLASQHRLLLRQKQQLQEREQHLQAIIENEPECIYIVGADGCLRQINPAGLKMLEADELESVLGLPLIKMVADAYRREFAEMHRQVLAGSATRLVFECIGLRGGRRWIETHAVPLHRDGGTLHLAVARDISERKQAEDALRESHQSMDLLLNSMAEGAYGLDVNGNCSFVNRSFLRILGYDAAEQVIGRHMHDLIHYRYPDGVAYPEAECRMYAVMKNKREFSCAEEVFWRRDGTPVPVEYWVQPIETDGEVHGAVVTFIDITERKKALEAVRQSELKFHALYDSTNDAVIMLDQQGCFDCNKAALLLFGCDSCQEFCHVGLAGLSLSPEADVAAAANLKDVYVKQAFEHGSARFEWRFRRLDTGQDFFADVQLSAMNFDGKAILQATIRDISERKQIEEQAQRLAFYDPLTQLPNRRLLNERIAQAISLNRRRGGYSALMFLDLDNFKPLNDAYGHAAGDLLLIEAARRLSECVREIDTVARFGGDEFVVMLGELSCDRLEALAQAGKVAEKICSKLAERYQLRLDDESEQPSRILNHQCTVSIGLTLFGNHDVRTVEVLKWADAAMYQAKHAGRNQIRIHDGGTES